MFFVHISFKDFGKCIQLCFITQLDVYTTSLLWAALKQPKLPLIQNEWGFSHHDWLIPSIWIPCHRSFSPLPHDKLNKKAFLDDSLYFYPLLQIICAWGVFSHPHFRSWRLHFFVADKHNQQSHLRWMQMVSDQAEDREPAQNLQTEVWWDWILRLQCSHAEFLSSNSENYVYLSTCDKWS